MSTETQDLRAFSGQSSSVVLDQITKVFPTPEGMGETTAVNHIDLEIADGEMVTLLGPSGCGKTTTLRMIAGFEYPSSGSIMIGDRDVANVPPNKRGISMVFQSYALFPHLSIWENVAYGLKVKKLPKEEMIARTGKIMKLMALDGYEKRFPNQLSGGQQQRVALARAVVIEPSVLLFDEPLSNLDAKLRERMRDELRALQKRLGITSLYVTHDQAEAMAISDRVVIMKDGNLMQVGTPQEIYEYPTSKFVANFIGKANFIDGQMLGKDSDGTAHVTVGGRSLSLANPGGIEVAVGQPCALAFRPESVKLDDPGLDGIPGKVTRVTYFGDKIEYEAAYGEHTVVIEVYNPQLAKHYREGDEVTMILDLATVRLLQQD
ncbi:MAG: ABC transporter ATP-binding protein [Propionibacteriaceae bacterium]|jgi:iron(III) transport system ATP-binding protein|nr:ABC transporter ATP-binding protein [Propionibacteriaceae bacterium]